MTTKTFIRKEALTITLLMLPFIVIPLIWNSLPDRIPIHWNLSGKVDRWTAPGLSLFFLPVVAVVVYVLGLIMPRIGSKNTRPFDKPMPALRLAITLVLEAIFFAAIASAGLDEQAMMRAVAVALSLLIVAVGNYLSVVEPNYLIGIRTPWTLASEDVWRSTHRKAGRLWVVLGLLLLIASFLWPWSAFGVFLGIACVIMLGYPVVWSYLHSRRIEHRSGAPRLPSGP